MTTAFCVFESMNLTRVLCKEMLFSGGHDISFGVGKHSRLIAVLHGYYFLNHIGAGVGNRIDLVFIAPPKICLKGDTPIAFFMITPEIGIVKDPFLAKGLAFSRSV